MATVGYLHIGLETRQAATVADPERAGVLNRPVVLNGQGEVEIPATGLIGALRHHLSDPEQHLGAERPESDQDPITPSRLRALGTRLTVDGDPVDESGLRVRSQTAIDRERGAAESRTLRSSQEVPPGAVIDLWCEYDGLIPESLVGELLTWQPWIGGARTQGQGSASVVSVGVGHLDLDDADDLAVFLGHGGPDLVERTLTDRRTVELAPPGPLLRLDVAIEGGLFTTGDVKSSTRTELSTEAESSTETGANTALALRDHDGELVIEGSSLKGVFRSRVALIASSVMAQQNHSDPVTAGNHLANTIFGTTERRGHLVFHRATIHLTAEPQVRPHVAIDRFTGGAAHGLLFAEEVATEGSFELRIDAIGSELPSYTRPLLLAVCADLQAGYAGVGGRVGRGYGTVSLTPSDEIDAALPLASDVVDAMEAAIQAMEAELETEAAPAERSDDVPVAT